MSEYLKRVLAEKRATAFEAAKSILDAAEARKEDLTDDEQRQYDAHNADISELAVRAAAIDKNDADNRAAEEMLRTAGFKGNEGEQVSAEDKLAGQFRSLAEGSSRGFDLNFSKGESARAYAAALPELRGRRSLVKGTATAGGNTVPVSFYDQLIQYRVDASGVLTAGPTILNTDSGELLTLPYVTSYGSAALVAEATAIPQADPTFAQRQLSAYKYGQLIQVSNELLKDTAVDLLGFIAKIAGRNTGLALGAHLLAGTGTNQPSGILTGATLGQTGGAGVAGAFTADDLIKLQYSVIGPYRNAPSAAFLVKDSSLGVIRGLKDGAGRYLFDLGQPGDVDRFNGKPIYTDVNMPAVALSAKSVLFGDISAFYVRNVGGIRFERSDDYAFNADVVTFRVLTRADSVLADTTGAVKWFQGNAA